MVKQEIVTFSDASSIETVSKPSLCAEATVHKELIPAHVGIAIEDFLRRPRQYTKLAWASTDVVGSSLATFNVPGLFLTSPMIKDKLSNFRFFRATANFSFRINANKFALGRLLIYTVPCPTGNYGYLTPLQTGSLTQHSAYPCCYLDAGVSNSVELVVPFTSFQSTIDLTAPINPQQWASVHVEVFNGLNSTSGSDTAEISVWAWLTDVSLTIPTHNPSSAILTADAQMESSTQAKTNSLSSIGKIAARAVSSLSATRGRGPKTNSPDLGWVGDLLSDALPVFGLSKPTSDTLTGKMLQMPADTFTNVNGESNEYVLGADHGNCVKVDTCDFACEHDELNIAYYAGHRALLDQFDWPLSAASNDVLAWWPVTPGFCPNGFNPNCAAPTPLGYAASMFTYWRGSIKYQFSFVANQFYTGRMTFYFLSGIYTPPTVTTGLLEGAPHVICDIRHTTDCVLEIPYINDTPYLEVKMMTEDGEGHLAKTVDSTRCLGIVIAVVENALKAPEQVPNVVPINVFVSGGDDIEFAVPTGQYRPQFSDPTTILRGEAQMADRSPLELNSNVETQNEAGDHVMTVTAKSRITPASHCIGEKIENFRPLLRRFQMEAEFFTLTPDISLRCDSRYLGADGQPSTLLHMICATYRFFKGSRRYMFPFIPDASEAQYVVLAPRSMYVTGVAPTPPTAIASPTTLGFDFEAYAFSNVLPVPTVKIPYYTVVTKRLRTNNSQSTYIAVVLKSLSSAGITVAVYSAGGDDFTCGHIIGPPQITHV